MTSGDAALRVFRLDNSVRRYAWGSVTAIADVLGIEPDGQPIAELWMGAHPDDPSHWRDHPQRPGLDELIAADPAGMLGESVAARFDNRLPFLLKLLAAERALSIQVHPNREQARAGFAGQGQRGVSPEDPARNYHDANHKPELACAVTEFEAWCGFRPVPGTVSLLRALGGAAADLVPILTAADGVRALFTTVLQLPEEARLTLLDSVAHACDRVVSAGSGTQWFAEADACLRAISQFPGDIGAVLTLMLNFVTLAPGEAIYLGAGNVHAYLHGTCIEILANSDNVLRCGLTPKHVDVAELLRIADFAPIADPRWASSVVEGIPTFEVPVPDFRLGVLELSELSDALTIAGPCIVFCLTGGFVLAGAAAGVQIVLDPGEAAFLAAGDPISLAGHGTAYLASVGEG